MYSFDKSAVAAIKRVDRISALCLALASAGLLFFAVCYPVARVYELRALLVCAYAGAPLLVAAGAAGAAICNFKSGFEKLMRRYVLDVCLENARALHPERNSLTFYITLGDCAFELRANDFKDALLFDFSAFERLSPIRKGAIATEIGNRLTITFCRLYERGASYADVSYAMRTDKKTSKIVPLIVNGAPDKIAFKIYLKHKNER